MNIDLSYRGNKLLLVSNQNGYIICDDIVYTTNKKTGKEMAVFVNRKEFTYLDSCLKYLLNEHLKKSDAISIKELYDDYRQYKSFLLSKFD